MLKRLKVFLISAGSIFLGGCLLRTYTIEKPRVDLEISGNQGYISGSAPQPRPEVKRTRRKITVIELELGTHHPQTEASQKKKEEETPSSEEEVTEESLIFEEPQKISEKAPVQPEVEEYTLYTVKKGDTLQKISRKFYNTTRRWKKIYEANKDILKTFDDIYPGQVLKIPVKK